jgi:hypothetical protein
LVPPPIGRIAEAIVSVPIRDEDRSEDPLLYVPRLVRQSPPVAPEEFTFRPPATNPRRQLSLDPELIPRPPIRLGRKPVVLWIGSLSFVCTLTAIIAFGVTLMTLWKQAGGISGVVTPLSPKAARLVVESQKGLTNEPLPLGVSVIDASGGEAVTVGGLAAGTKVLAGAPLGLTGWRVSAYDLDKAFAYAPKNFVGVMDAAIDLRSAGNRVMDSQVVRLEWIQKKEERLTRPLEPSKPPPVIQTLGPEEIATMLKRGEDFLKNGDIASARLLLKRAANVGNAKAALELGMTFDPVFLAERGVLGSAPDVVQARAWYERAMELGLTEASGRLEGLASIGR